MRVTASVKVLHYVYYYQLFITSILCDLVKTFNIHVAVYLYRPLGASYSIPKTSRLCTHWKYHLVHCTVKKMGNGEGLYVIISSLLTSPVYMAVARGYGQKTSCVNIYILIPLCILSHYINAKR